MQTIDLIFGIINLILFLSLLGYCIYAIYDIRRMNKIIKRRIKR